MKIAVGLLVYNEEESIKNTILDGYKKLEDFNLNFELWIFDNNSSDSTPGIINNLLEDKNRLRYFKQDKNVGYGLNAISALTIPEADIYFAIDGDGQYDLIDVLPAIEKIKNENEVIFGIRSLRTDPFYRKILSYFFNIFSKILINSNLKDINCGFRAWSKKAKEKITIKYKYNYVNPEIFIKSKINKLNINEIKVKHYDRKSGVSYYHGFLKIFINCLIMIKYLFQLRNDLKNFYKKDI